LNPIQKTITGIAILSFLIALFWIVRIMKRAGGSFYVTKILFNGETSQRFDFTLARNFTMVALLFAAYIFLAGNFVCFILFDEWVFGLEAAKGTLLGVLIYTIYYIIEYVYSFAEDKSEKHVYIREDKRARGPSVTQEDFQATQYQTGSQDDQENG
jgi:hypothetical protein